MWRTLPPGVVNVVNGYGAVAGARLAEHPDVDMIALTGSVSSGRAVARAAADTLKRVHLELGGKAPVVIRALVVGEPTSGEDVEVGPMVSRAHFDRVTGYLERAKNAGIRVATGGGAIDGPGYFVAPAVLVDVPEGAEVAREEIFGPVVTVETFADDEEAVRRANDVPFGLSASVWTENARRSHDIAARLDFGTVWVNSQARDAPPRALIRPFVRLHGGAG
ncbi:hypothetical protein AQI88_16485 [Streptomyces cellostaticus]|uniref:Aldehyde dehydrogenase domain-containing protein n=1 Tax=Streptomyces cellostaticus TaxID=67285 RepID=A0A101NMA6_9ACTN|nr:aldehyde dehydrogenase family protein [Streptomyces cellostaticus]KUM95659.1 hypothetical protein AQI88_16485 [Streptomyces cellostaticus]GHI09743.1 hypothetical protein Scel_80640 [Streptomyces cellostaticus]